MWELKATYSVYNQQFYCLLHTGPAGAAPHRLLNFKASQLLEVVSLSYWVVESRMLDAYDSIRHRGNGDEGNI